MDFFSGIVIGFLITLVLTALVFLVLRKFLANFFTTVLAEKTEKSFYDERERLGAERSGEKDLIKEMLNNFEKRILQNQQQLTQSDKDRLGQFSEIKTLLREHQSLAAGLKESTDSLKNILSNNQLRGQFGEQVAEQLLQSVGFVKGQHYTTQTSQESSGTRPDITILLSDGAKLNIDTKFPYQALQRYVSTEDKEEKKQHLKQFANDVRQKVRDVATRDYINPEEDTMDFVILFIPNEMIFSFIYDQLNDVWDEAFKKKVVMAGPFSFTAILRTVHLSYRTFSTQQNIRHILQDIRTFGEEYKKYTKEVDVLGTRISSVEQQYKKVAETRDKKLSRVVEKITSDDTLEEIDLIEENKS